MVPSISWEEIAARLLLAALLGGIVGLERERKDWAAGLRTHMMVCVGATLAMLVSTFGFSDGLGHDNVELDPSRIASGVISGIGFLGAGTIMFLRNQEVRGLTTASGLWAVAAVGLATGSGMYFAAVLTTVIAVFILWVMQYIQEKFLKKYQDQTIKILTSTHSDSLAIAKRIMENEKIEILNLSVEKENEDSAVYLKVRGRKGNNILHVLNTLQEEKKIKDIFWNKNA
ncbi:MgtC/SapB family protein [Telluribacter sp.]|jgi:putative Mg2+ transporter-C (MgtC) family protein|uniref:MgtC/SapB family protein n=1 Tax=Telluribacter sp. TaxID=1978767 RepID=UPI002E0F1604|nr:MgtC/SapB family protein [Telluribacter sp.]